MEINLPKNNPDTLSKQQKIELTLDDLISIWEKDSLIDETELAQESLKINKLHSKYFSILSLKNMERKSLEPKIKRMYKIKLEYYSGKMSDVDLKKFNWQPFGHILSKNDIETYVNADQDMCVIFNKKDTLDEIIEYLKGIIKELNNRTWQIKNAIEWHKLTRGMN